MSAPTRPAPTATDRIAEQAYSRPVAATVAFMAVLWSLTAILGGSPWAIVVAIVGPFALVLPFWREVRATVRHYLGDHPGAARDFRALADRSHPGGQRDLLNRLNAGACWLAAGDIQAGKAALAPVDLEDLGPLARAIHCVNLSHLYWQLGDGESALALAEAAASHPFLGSRFLDVYVAGNAAQALVQLGRFAEAEERLDAYPPRRIPSAMRDHWRALRAACRLDAGDAVGARRSLGEPACPLGAFLDAILARRLDGDWEPARVLGASLPERHEALDAATRASAWLLVARAHRHAGDAAAAEEAEEEVLAGPQRDRLEAWLDAVLEGDAEPPAA